MCFRNEVVFSQMLIIRSFTAISRRYMLTRGVVNCFIFILQWKIFGIKNVLYHNIDFIRIVQVNDPELTQVYMYVTVKIEFGTLCESSILCKSSSRISEFLQRQFHLLPK